MDELHVSIETAGFQPLAVFLRDDAGRIVGGAYGRTNWNWLHIATVWVAEAARGKGLGRQVMLAIEGAAAEGAASAPISIRSAIRPVRSTRRSRMIQ